MRLDNTCAAVALAAVRQRLRPLVASPGWCAAGPAAAAAVEILAFVAAAVLSPGMALFPAPAAVAPYPAAAGGGGGCGHAAALLLQQAARPPCCHQPACWGPMLHLPAAAEWMLH